MVMTRCLTTPRGMCLSDPAELRIKTGSEQITLPDVSWHWMETADDKVQCMLEHKMVFFLIKQVVSLFKKQNKVNPKE